EQRLQAFLLRQHAAGREYVGRLGPCGIARRAKAYFLALASQTLGVTHGIRYGVVSNGGEPAHETAGGAVGETWQVAVGTQQRFLNQIVGVELATLFRSQLVTDEHRQSSAVAIKEHREGLFGSLPSAAQKIKGSGWLHSRCKHLLIECFRLRGFHHNASSPQSMHNR